MTEVVSQGEASSRDDRALPVIDFIFDVSGMTCAACAQRVQYVASAVEGVSEVEVNLLKATLHLKAQGGDEVVRAVAEAIHKAGYELMVPTGEGVPQEVAQTSEQVSAPKRAAQEQGKRIRELIVCFVFAIPLFYLGMGWMLGWPLPTWFNGSSGAALLGGVQALLCIPIIVACRVRLVRGLQALIYFGPTMDSLIAVGTVASVAWSCVGLVQLCFAAQTGDHHAIYHALHGLSFESVGMILALVILGRTLEANAKSKTTDAVQALIDLAPKTAHRVCNGKEEEIAVDRLALGDMVIVRAGETLPVDGVVRIGGAAVDESALTGEPLPRDVEPGVAVCAATVVANGWIMVEATAAGENTTLASIVRLVDEATASKAPIERMADRVAAVFVPCVMAIAAAAFVVWLVVAQDVTTALSFAVSVLVVSCPCALGLATPTAVMVGMGMGARQGILIRSAASLEALARITTIAFDKTGTLTEGVPSVVGVRIAQGVDEAEVARIAYALEKKSIHPLAHAVVMWAHEILGAEDAGAGSVASEFAVEELTQVAGGGLRALVNGEVAFVGNARFAESEGVVIPGDHAGFDGARTLVHVAYQGRLLATLAIADRVRTTSAPAVAALHALGVKSTLLTGDAEGPAQAVARELGIDAVRAGIMPEHKDEEIRKLQAAGEKVAMVGDGINDAPALARANVGIAVGAGTDVAIRSADVILMRSDPADLVSVIDLSRATLRTIKQNLFWALIYNAICISVAAGLFAPWGISLNPMAGAAAMGLSSLFVVTNALRLRGWKPRVVPTASVHDTPAAAPEVVAASYAGSGDSTTDKENIMATTTRRFTVTGMSCMHCVAHVKAALEGVAGEGSATVDLDRNLAMVTADESITSDQLMAAVVDAGYQIEALSE